MRTAIHGDIAIAGGGKALISFKSTSSKNADVTKIIFDTPNSIGEVAAWGPNNDYPNKLLDNLRLNGAGSQGLGVLIKTHYGKGFLLAEETFNEDGKREVKPKSIKQYDDINAFWKKSQMKRFWRETIKDLEYWAIAFPEYILSMNYNQINKVASHQAANCRFSVMNEDTGYIENVHISKKWRDGVSVDSKYVSTIPLIDSYWSAEEVKAYCKKNKIRNFVRPVFFPLVDETYYPKPPWHAVNNNGWFAVANSIPKFKEAIFNNQINIKYHIEVHEEYFERKYKGDWEEMEPEKRNAIRTNFVDEVDEALRDTSKAGGSIMSLMYKDDAGNAVSGIKITAIDDKYKEGSYLPEASAANSEILFALGVDPSLIGAGIPGGKLGAGSGSDKRESFLILTALSKTNRETTLEIFEFIQEYNGWDDKLTGHFGDTILTTLDENPTGTQTAAQV